MVYAYNFFKIKSFYFVNNYKKYLHLHVFSYTIH